MEVVHISDTRKPDVIKEAETALLEELRSGSRHAFETLYRCFWDKLYLTAYNILRDRETCEDVIQEIFAQLWIRRETQKIDNLKAYLFTAVRFQIFRCIKEKKCKNEFVNQLAALPVDFFDSSLVEKELDEAVKTGIEKLPKKCKEIFVLSRHEHLSNKEIALQLDVSIKTVENQMTIAIKKMRKYMAHWNTWALLVLISRMLS